MGPTCFPSHNIEFAVCGSFIEVKCLGNGIIKPKLPNSLSLTPQFMQRHLMSLRFILMHTKMTNFMSLTYETLLYHVCGSFIEVKCLSNGRKVDKLSVLNSASHTMTFEVLTYNNSDMLYYVLLLNYERVA